MHCLASPRSSTIEHVLWEKAFAEFARVSAFALYVVLISLPIFHPPVALGQTSETVLATVNGNPITQKEVDDSVAARVLPLHQQLYALRKVALENLITKLLLEGEAAKRKITVEELRKGLLDGPINITSAQVEAAYVQNSAFFATMSPDEAKERLRLDLESQARMKNYRAAVEKLRTASSVTVMLSPASVLSISEVVGSPALGSSNPVVTIIEFSDFQCPFCASVQPALKQILREYGSKVKLVFKNLPLESHRNSISAARAAYCAGQQDRFWQFHDALFASRNFVSESFKTIAQGLGLGVEKFQSCINSPESLNAITKDIEIARRFGIESTPSFVINGTVVSGAISFSEFQNLIKLELQRSSGRASSSK